MVECDRSGKLLVRVMSVASLQRWVYGTALSITSPLRQHDLKVVGVRAYLVPG